MVLGGIVSIFVPSWLLGLKAGAALSACSQGCSSDRVIDLPILSLVSRRQKQRSGPCFDCRTEHGGSVFSHVSQSRPCC